MSTGFAPSGSGWVLPSTRGVSDRPITAKRRGFASKGETPRVSPKARRADSGLTVTSAVTTFHSPTENSIHVPEHAY